MKKQFITEAKRFQELAGLNELMQVNDNGELEDLSELESTNWDEYEWDFSDESAVNFSSGSLDEFDVEASEFEGTYNSEKPYVTDMDGVKHEIDEETFNAIQESYDENHADFAE